jgi:hypothetical protein
MQLAKKHSKVAPSAISTFFGTKIPYKKLDEVQQLFLKHLVLLIAKGFSLSTCENIWMQKLEWRLDLKFVFPF